MDNKPKVRYGERKTRHAFQQSILLTVGFIIAVAAKAPHELFISFVTGLAAISGAYIYGNVKNHQASVVSQDGVAPSSSP